VAVRVTAAQPVNKHAAQARGTMNNDFFIRLMVLVSAQAVAFLVKAHERLVPE
jgi:hypothetical protein